MIAASGKIVRVGRVISALASFTFAMSALMKLKGGTELTQAMAHLGLPESMILSLAILELDGRGIPKPPKHKGGGEDA